MSARRRKTGVGRRLLELLKDLLIAALVVVVAVLTILALPRQLLLQMPGLTGALRPVAGVLGFEEAELAYTAPPAEHPLSSAAQPIAVTLRNTAGRRSAQYDFDALDMLNGQLGMFLAQALDSASELQRTEQTEVLDALSRMSVAFCYPDRISPQTAAAWLSVRAPQAQDAQWYILAQEGEAVRLYLVGDGCFTAQTSLPAGMLAAQLESYTTDSSFFAFEDRTGRYETLDALSLITEPSVYKGSFLNPCDARFIASLAGRLGFNPYGDARYVDNSGATHFTETACALSVSAQGVAELNVLSEDPRFAAESAEQTDRIEAARALLAELSGDALGEARLYLRSYREDGGDAVCTFACYLAGVEISEPDGPAEVCFRGAQITSARVRVRTYSVSAVQQELLRSAQAAAITAPGSALRLLYIESSDGQLLVNWKK